MASTTNLQVGARCEIQGSWGVIRFVGTTAFAPGRWVGVELDEPQGKNDGSVKGQKYFQCQPNHGVFVRTSQIKTVVGPNVSSADQSSQNTQSESSGRETPRFAPAHDPNSTTARSRLRSSLPGRINTAIPSRAASRGPVSPTSSRMGSTHARTPSSPTFAKRTRQPSEAGSVDLKRMSVMSDLDSSYMDVEDESDLALYEEPESTVVESLAHPVKQDTPTQNAKAPDPFSLQDSSSSIREQTVPLKDYEELRLKLKILENKRQEDREKWRESEKAIQEAEQVRSIKPKLQAKMNEMQAEQRDLKKQLKDALAEKELLETKYNEALESVEMMALDKEMAEEKAENLQHEVNMLKEKVEEISVDLNVFQQGEILSQADASGEGRSAVEVLQLERQNERLKEALVRLRDVTTEQEAELNRKIKALEKELSSLQDIQVQHDHWKNQLKTAEAQIEDLKARLDDAMNADDMLEQLTEKNLAMSEKLEEMRATIDDLEAIKELNDELEESHIETEKQLQTEIDQKDMSIREGLKRIEMMEETNADYENTINQFRELVANLQSDLERMRSQSASSNLDSQSQAMLNLNFQLQSTVMKAQAKQIDLELRKLDATQASDNLEFVQPYLPDVFFNTEKDSISCLLLLKRLVFKSELIIKQLDQIHNIPEKLNTTVPEELIAVCEMRQKLAWFSDLAKRLVTFVSGCPVDVFLKMGQVYHDLMGAEKRLNALVGLLRKEELKESECLTDVQRSIAQLEHLAEIYLSNTNIDEGDKYYLYVRAVDLNADTVAVTLGHIKQAVALACKDPEIHPSESMDQFNAEFFQPLQTLVSQSKSSKVMARKLLRRLDDLIEQSSTMKSDILSQFKACYNQSSKLASSCQQTWKNISGYINDKKATKELFMISGLSQIVYKVTENVLGVNEMHMWEGCAKTLQGLCQEISNLNNISNESDQVQAIVKNEAPWVARARNIKAEVAINVDTERKLQKSSEEIRGLVKELKIKEQDLQEGQVKIELLEKRMETFKKQAEEMAKMDDELQSYRDQDKQQRENLDNLAAELKTLERENNQFKNLAQKLDEQGLSPTASKHNTLTDPQEEDMTPGASQEAETSPEITALSDLTPIENTRLTSQLETLKFAVRYLRAENAHLKGCDAMNVLNIHLQPMQIKENEDDEFLKKLAGEAKSLLKTFRAVCASPRIVDLTTNQKGWQKKEKKPDYQYQAQQSMIFSLQQRSNELKSKLHELGKKNKLQPFKTPGLSSQPPFVGRIQVPVTDSSELTKMHHDIQIKTASDYEKIHTIFVN